MKYLVVSIVILFVLKTIPLEAQSYTWVKSISDNSGFVTAYGVSSDAHGNSYLTGSFTKIAIFDTIQLNAGSGGLSDIFIAKYNSRGNCVWAKRAGNWNSDFGKNIFVDSNGNSYITGSCSQDAVFDSIHFTATLPCIFIAKYDSNGNCLWAKHCDSKEQGGQNLLANSISADSKGNSYITGYFYGTAIFDTVHLTSFGGNDIFIAKFDPDGNCLWAKQAGGIDQDNSNGISIDAYGNSYITGEFMSTAKFDTLQLTSFGTADIFIAKYDTYGNCLWAKQYGGIYVDMGNSISRDLTGNLYVTGSCRVTSSFGSVQITSYGLDDMFIAKLDSEGNCLWAKHAGSVNFDYGFGVSVDVNGNSYIVGTFEGDASFDSIKKTSSGGDDIFVSKYNPDGNCIWTMQAGGDYFDNGKDHVYGISINNNGNIFFVGDFAQLASFDSIHISSNYVGGYIAMISDKPTGIINNKTSNPDKYSLCQNYPNPFNPITVISYSLPSASTIKLILFNTLGQEVKTLENGYKNAGNYTINFNATNLPSGIYFYKLEAGQFTQVKKMMLLK
jgi:hypothetical protein